jgi:PST family polysaccharide transporter
MSNLPRSILQSAPDRSLTDRVRKGALWAGGSSLFLRFANIAIMAVVARIVAPAELGVFALTLVVHGVVVSLAELGVSSAIARSDLDIDRIAPTVATISIATSLALASIMAFFATPIAFALGAPEAAASLRIMALCVAMIGVFAVPGAQLQREFRQDLVFRATAISFVPSSIVLVTIAALGDGAVGFAWSRVVGQLVMGTIMALSVSKRYWPGLNSRLVGPLVKFGLPLALANLLSQVLLNVDYVFVGRFLGIVDVGLYNLAFNISMWSTATLSSILNGIVLPAFSKVKAEGGDLTAALKGGTRTVALICFPIGAMTLALAYPLIATVYGDQWVAAAPVLGILAIYGVISVLCLLFANVVISTGRTGILFAVQAAALVCLVPGLWAGVTLGGLTGVGIAHIVVISAITLPAYLVAIKKSIKIGPILLFKAMVWPGIGAALAGAVAWAVASAVPSAPVQLMLGGVSGAIVYVVAVAPLLSALLPESGGTMGRVGRLLGVAGVPVRWIVARLGRGETSS